jgi:hypothetical protein
MYGTCFRQDNRCAEDFLNIHVNNQMFNKYPDDRDPPKTPSHSRLGFQTLGTDFAF